MSASKHLWFPLVALGLLSACSTDDDHGLPACTSADVAPLSLASDYCAVQRVALSETPAAFAVGDDAVWTLTTKGARSLQINEWSRTTEKLGELGAPSTFLAFDADTTEDIFPSQFLARSPGGLLAAGYNTADFTNPKGAVYWGKKSDTPIEAQANGNYDVVFLGDTRLLINGKGAGTISGQGVYLIEDGKPTVKLIDNLGDGSGPLAFGQDVLFAGGFFPDEPGGFEGQTRLFAFSRAEIQAAARAGTTLSAAEDGSEVFRGSVLDATALANDLIVARFDASFAFADVQRVPVTITGDDCSAGAPQTMIDKGQGGALAALSGDTQTLAVIFADGSDQPHLAVVRSR